MTEKEGQPVIETGHRLKVNLPIEAKDLARVDAVLYTHADGDHFGRMTAEVLRSKPVAIVLHDDSRERAAGAIGSPVRSHFGRF